MSSNVYYVCSSNLACSAYEGRKKAATRAKKLELRRMMQGIGLSSSAQIGASTVSALAMKLQMPADVALL